MRLSSQLYEFEHSLKLVVLWKVMEPLEGGTLLAGSMSVELGFGILQSEFIPCLSASNTGMNVTSLLLAMVTSLF